MRKYLIIIPSLIIVLASVAACTPAEVQQLEGILQNVDTAKGEITIVTKDGQTITLDIDSETAVADGDGGTSSDLGTLEVGASIEVEVDQDGQVVRRIKTDRTETGETTAGIDGNATTASPESDTTPATENEAPPAEKVEPEGSSDNEAVVEKDSDTARLIEEMEAERERLAEEIRKRTAAGEVDEEWVREVEAERERLAEEIRRLQEGSTEADPPDSNNPDNPVDKEVITTISGEIQAIDGNLWTVIVNGQPVVIDVSKLNISTTPAVGSKVTIDGVQSGNTIIAREAEVDTGTDSHPGDGQDDHPEDDHPEDDHPEDDHPEDDHLE